MSENNKLLLKDQNGRRNGRKKWSPTIELEKVLNGRSMAETSVNTLKSLAKKSEILY